jgi:D-sedoheptulose 7-phosphate isomerase
MVVVTTTDPTRQPTVGTTQIAAALADRARALSAMLSLMATNERGVARAAGLIAQAFRGGNKTLVCGNGGSAAEAQHFAGELVGRFRRERAPWPALALTADAAVVTALGNDYGFDQIFARQVTAFGQRGDVLVGFSTSGASANVVNAARAGQRCGLRVVAFTGQEPTTLGRLADVAIAVPSHETALIQETHTVLVHLICELVESTLTADRPEDSQGWIAPFS